MWKGFTAYLFGSRYEKAVKSSLVCLFVFCGLRQAEVSVRIAPGILYLMTGTVTIGAMWQDLSAKNEALAGKNLFMLPFSGWRLTASYVGALGSYAVITRTGILLAVVLAVSPWGMAELTGCLICALYSILAAALIYGESRKRRLILLWMGGTVLMALWLSGTCLFHVILFVNSLAAAFFLKGMDAYAFYEGEGFRFPVFGTASVLAGHRPGKGVLIWNYFFRYLWCHKNYLINLVILWGVAAGLPLFFGQTEREFVLTIGCSLLTLNTPVCILLSADPDLEQAVRTLPGQRMRFVLPYGMFLFACSLAGDLIFLCSLWLKNGQGRINDICLALILAGLGAAGSVLMEWYFPIRRWKTQSDLWHHPRKYVIPGLLLLLTGIFLVLF